MKQGPAALDDAPAEGQEPETPGVVRVYRYGLLPPIYGAQVVDEQMRLAHRYQNTLVEIERSRREAVRAILSTHSSVEALGGQVAELEADLAQSRAAIKAVRQADRARSEPPEAREAAQELRRRLATARAELKAAKAALRDDAAVQAQIAEVNTLHREKARQARAASGVYWGTYLQIEQAMDAARRGVMDPRFRRWTGGGAVAVQAQGGLAIEDALSGEDRRVRIRLEPSPVPGRGGKPLPRLFLRVGSDGREPVWAEWPLIYGSDAHPGKLLPQGRIKWAMVTRRRVASHDHWSLCLTVETDTAAGVDRAGVVAVDLGWRREADTIRAGGWADSESHSEDVFLDPAVRGMLRKAEDLRSIRDKHLNELQAWILAWREGRPLSAEHTERMAHIGLWRAAGRFASLAIWWREHRFDGDDEAFEQLEAWRKKDKHLWEWEANARRKALLRRLDQYRVLAKQLAEQHGTLVIERLDLRALAQIPKPESTEENHPRARAQRVETAPAELRTALVQAFRKLGRLVVTVPPSGPASSLLAAYRERSGAEELPVVARVSRFKRLRAAKTGDTPKATDAGSAAR